MPILPEKPELTLLAVTNHRSQITSFMANGTAKSDR